VVSGCKKDARVDFIQGGWYYKDAHLANIPGESAQVTSWEFDNYYFATDSCCFTETYFSGYYSISERNVNKLSLELCNMRGQMGGMNINKDDTFTIFVRIDPDTDTIMVSGDGPYTRVGP
jgi:hypothetical protein